MVKEVRPIFNPHPPEALTGKFNSHLVMSVNEEVPRATSPKLMKICADLEHSDPDTYGGNAYRRLMEADLLPRGGTWGLVRGVADCTPHDDAINNRTRWALQVLLVHYYIHFGEPPLNASFLYVWHDTAFRFAGHSRTINKLAWVGMELTPLAGYLLAGRRYGQEIATEFGCTAIKYTNQPDGTLPYFMVPVREKIDEWSVNIWLLAD